MEDEAIWIFGYGSLVWRPAFAFEERRPAFVQGFARRFWQGSTDHRGVPGAPGRVVTLCAEPGERCFGTAYRVAQADVAEVVAALDDRERGGFDRIPLELHFNPREAPDRDGRDREGPVRGCAYVATEHNPNYLGEASLDEIAAQVLSSHGPSGSNVEYVVRLGEALREIGAVDPHVFALEVRVRGGRPA